MKTLVYQLYNRGNAGLSNLIMSAELGVVMARLTDRLLVLKDNVTPPANVVHYDGVVHNGFPSRITDLLDLGVPWIDVEDYDLAAVAPHELGAVPPYESVFYFPPHLSTKTRDFHAFARGREAYVTAGEDLQHVPALSFSGGPDALTLSFYSYFFYLDAGAQMLAHDALSRVRPKSELAAFARRVADDLGPFNAVHIRRGDFKKTIGVTTLERTPSEALEVMDAHFDRTDLLVVLTDEAGDPFFDDIKSAYGNHLFLDHHILENYGADFADLPAHDSIALAYLSQLVAADSVDFIGSMTSTFTSLIQRMRGNRGKAEPFKFLWNELPAPGEKLERGRHSRSDSIVLDRGVMVEEGDGPYTWNRVNARLNPSWMREWPEAFLDEAAMLDRARGREVAVLEPEAPGPAGTVKGPHDRAGCRVSFQGELVEVSSDCSDVIDAVRRLFERMAPTSDATVVAHVRLETSNGRSRLSVDGVSAGENLPKPQRVRCIYREVVRAFIERHRDLVWLHAGCAANAAGALALPGAWGRGKSSLVMELYGRGWSFLSDDITPLDPSAAVTIPFPGTPQVRKRIDKELPRDRLGNIPKFATSLDPARVAGGTRPLTMIAFPCYKRGADAVLTRLSPGEAVKELLENCLSFADNEDTTIERLCALVEDVPAYRLEFGDVGEAADLLVAAQEAAGGSGALTGEHGHGEGHGGGMSEAAQTIDVEVTLSGNQRHSTKLPAGSPILHDLHAALAAPQPITFLQLPLDGGRAACSFPSTSLVSVTTRPPVLVRLQSAEPGILQGASAQSSRPPEPAPFVRIDDFLTPDENRQLLDFVVAEEANFEGSSVTTGDEGYRRSSVHFGIRDTKWNDIVVNRLKLHIPHIEASLGLLDLAPREVEIQLTASNDGDYFKAHRDAAHDQGETGRRILTFVYYVNREPKPYSGGNLLFYDGDPRQLPGAGGAKSVTAVEPQNNCLVAFATDRMHEVDLVRCPSGAFADSRFTVNGWLLRARS